MDEHGLARLFELEPEEDAEPCEHATLPKDWRELVCDFGLCERCPEVEWIRLAAVWSE
jgi:hypothetical protein